MRQCELGERPAASARNGGIDCDARRIDVTEGMDKCVRSRTKGRRKTAWEDGKIMISFRANEVPPFSPQQIEVEVLRDLSARFPA
jgi:hypothetical protein